MRTAMTAQEMHIALENLRELALQTPDRVLFSWMNHETQCQEESRWNRYVSLRFAFLGAVWAEGENIRAAKMAGTVTRDRDRIQKLLFNYGNLVRIKGGPRSNMVVMPERLYPDESGVMAGLEKVLEYGGEGYRFMAGRDGDMDFLYNINAGLFSTVPVKVEDVLSPMFYIKTRDATELRARINGNLMGVLKGMQYYDASLSLNDNFRRCSDQLYTEDPGDQESWRLYPFSYCEGKGSIVMDADQVPHSFSMLKSAFPFDDGLLQVQLPINKPKEENHNGFQRDSGEPRSTGRADSNSHTGHRRLQAREGEHADVRYPKMEPRYRGGRSGDHATNANRGRRLQRDTKDHWNHAGHLYAGGKTEDGGGADVPGSDGDLGDDMSGWARGPEVHDAIHVEVKSQGCGDAVLGHPVIIQDIPPQAMDAERQNEDGEPVYDREQSSFFPT